MSTNLLDSLSGIFNSDLIKKAASSFGESEGSVSKAVGAGVPSLLSGIMSTAGTDGGSNLLSLAKQAAGSGILDNVGGLFSGGSSNSLISTGSSMLSGLLGNKAGGLASLISGFAGVRQSTATSVLSAIAPIALGFIGRHAVSNNLSGSGILGWLSSQKSDITKALPAGLNLSGIFNGGDKIPDSVRHTMVEESTKKTNWIVPVIIGLAVIGLLWYFLKGCNNKDTTPAVVDTVAATPMITDTVVAVTPAPARESVKVKLPDGTELDAYKGGIEDKLVAFLNDATAKPGKDVWFDFDNLNFESGSASITAASQAQIKNIAAILKAYPKAVIKIGGYTDVTGDAAANKKLSQDRANAVVVALKASGSNAAQLTGAEGYGSQFAKAAASAPDAEKAKDRRIAVSVRKK